MIETSISQRLWPETIILSCSLQTSEKLNEASAVSAHSPDLAVELLSIFFLKLSPAILMMGREVALMDNDLYEGFLVANPVRLERGCHLSFFRYL